MTHPNTGPAATLQDTEAQADLPSCSRKAGITLLVVAASAFVARKQIGDRVAEVLASIPAGALR